MKLDITEIMNRRKDRLDFSFDFKFPDFPDGALLPAGVTLAGPAQIDCRVTDVNGFIKADFTVHAPLRCVCVRCLEEFEFPLDFSFERFAELDGSDDLDCDADEVLTVKDSALFPDADIAEEISLEAPFRPLCSEDCPGLCPTVRARAQRTRFSRIREWTRSDVCAIPWRMIDRFFAPKAEK